MEVLMQYTELEKKLKKRVRIQRLIKAALSVIFFAITMIFYVLYENSKVVEDIGLELISYQEITYNTNYLFGIMVGLLGLIPSVWFLLMDFLIAKIVSVKVGHDVITFYRGAFGSTLYINGEQKDSKRYARYLESTLSDGTYVTVMVRGTRKGRFIFSNGHPPIEP